MDFTTTVGFQVSIFLFAALAGYLIAVRFGQSAVIGEIIIGIFIGPSILGLVHYTEVIKILAELGAIFLLFVVGLHCRFKDIYTKKNAVIAVFGVIIPFILGFFVTRLFGYTSLHALFIGTALTATSVAITVNVLKEMGKLDADFAKAIIGAAVIDDVLSLLMLSITTGVVKGSVSAGGIILVIVLAAAFLIGATYLGRYLSKIMVKMQLWSFKHEMPQLIVIFAMAIAFGYSAVAESIGLSAIIGAFIAGISLENVGFPELAKYKEGASYFEMLFSAIFFVSIGVLFNIHETGFSVFGWFLLALLFVAIISKIIGCYVPAVIMGIKAKSALVVGIGMVPRGEVAMIIALFGLNAGIIQQDLYGVIILVALFTTIFVPYFLKMAVGGANKKVF